DRVLSVLVLVRELKREPASFLVIVARLSQEGVEPCHSRRRGREGASESKGTRLRGARWALTECLPVTLYGVDKW
ncbi:hypothetical protein CH063_15762, partial [Colletotrichum higginsianum]